MPTPACCFTGHRPQKLSFGFDEEHNDCIQLKAALTNEIKAMLDKGITTFYTGMALGTDMWAAEIVLALAKTAPKLDVKLIAIIPFAGQADRWSAEYRKRYLTILENATEVITLNKHYTNACMHERNRYMVDHTTHVIAVYNGSVGGTKNTVDYAKRMGLDIVIINP